MNVGSLVAAISVLIAALAIVLSGRQALRQRQLDVALSLGSEYREAWRTRWHVIPKAVIEAHGDPAGMPPDLLMVLVDALNWIDWFGVACEEKVIQRPDFVFRTVGPSMSQLIRCAEPILTKDTVMHGDRYWGGVLFVSQRLGELGMAEMESDQWRLGSTASENGEGDDGQAAKADI